MVRKRFYSERQPSRLWDLIVSVPDHCLSFYFSAQIVLIIEISRSCRRCTFRDCLENKTSPPPHLSCVSERFFRIKVKPLIDMRLSGWCVPNNDSQMPNISGELLLENMGERKFVKLFSHITKMAAMPKIFSGTKTPMTFKLDMQHMVQCCQYLYEVSWRYLKLL